MRVVSRLLAGLVCIAAILTVPAAGALARGRPDVYAGNNGIIAFVRSNQIYTMDPNGANITQLTTGPGLNYNPVWSPNGQRIAYIHEWPRGVRNVWEMNANGTAQQQWTTGGGAWGQPAWSPDGTQLAFSAGNTEPQSGYLAATNADVPLTGITVLYGENTDNGTGYQPVFGYNPSWSEQGNIAFTANADIHPAMCDEVGTFGETDNCIEIYDPNTGAFSAPVNAGGYCAFEGLNTVDYSRWTPDGSGLIFQWKSDGDCSPPTPWTLGSVGVGVYALNGDQNADFSPNGQYLVLANAYPGQRANIIVEQADGADRQVITQGYQPDWQSAPTPAPLPPPNPRMFCAARVNHTRPRLSSLVSVIITSKPGATVFTRTHFRGRVHAKGGRTNSLGQVQIAYAVRPFAPGVRVPVTVRAIKAGRLASCETFFTPR